MQGKIDTSFQTVQRDMFSSGLAAELGPNALVCWLAVKNHADFNNGHSWPGVRAIAETIGISKSNVDRLVDELVEKKMLRVVKKGVPTKRGQTYVARERMCIRLGDRVLCTIYVDYIPSGFREKLHKIAESLKTGENDPDAWAEVEIVPGPDFVWDAARGSLMGKVKIDQAALPEIEGDGGKAGFDELAARLLLGRGTRTSG